MTKLLLFIVFISLPSYAGKFDVQLNQIKEKLAEYARTYRIRLEENQRSKLAEFYYKRSRAREVINQEILEDSAAENAAIKSLLTDQSLFDGDDVQNDLYNLHLVKENLLELNAKLSNGLKNLSEIRSSFDKECSSENLMKVHKKTDPLTMYPIPTFARDDMGTPVMNMSFSMNMNYSIEGGETSFSGSAPMDPSDDDKELVVVVVAGIAQGIACAFGECTGTTFMIATAVVSFVYDLVANILKQDAYEDFIEDVDKEYAKVNSEIKAIHQELSVKNIGLIQEQCSKMSLEDAIFNYDKSMELISSLIASQQSDLSKVEQSMSIFQQRMNIDNQMLQAMFKNKREQFLQKIRNQLADLRLQYAKKGAAAVRYFATQVRPAFVKMKKMKGLDHLREQRNLMNILAKGDQLFGDYVVWTSAKRSLR